MADRLHIGGDGQVYLDYPNDPPIEDDWGYSVLVTPEELLKAARHFLSEDLIIGDLEVQGVNK